MDWPTWRDGVFSLRTFCAAILAAWIALRINLSSPGTAMLTAYIVSQPLTGMMLSKSVYRVIGTAAGVIASMTFIGLFAQERELFVLASALWFGCCIYVSVLLRDAPSAYAPLLAGYTAAIIGFPAITAPDTVFDIATNRCVEILLAIGCAGVLSAIVLPRPVGPVLLGRIEALLAATATWAVGILRTEGTDEAPQADRARLIGDAVALETLRAHAVFDTRAIRLANDVVRQLQGRLFTFLAVLVSVQERGRLLRFRDPARWQEIRPAFEAVARIMDRSPGPDQPDDGESIGAARRLIDTLQPTLEELRQSQTAMVVRILLDRLQDVLTLRDDCRRLRDHVAAGTRPRSMGSAPSVSRHRDQAAAIMAGITAFTALVVACSFWILTAWPNGAAAATILVVVFGFFSGADEPALPAKEFLRMAAVASIVYLLYFALVLPRVDGFPMLALVLATVLVPAGVLMPAPRIGASGLLLCINFLTLLGLSDRASLDFAGAVNNSLATLAGIALAVLLFRLIRPLGVRWMAQRFVTGIMADLSRMASGAGLSQAEFESRMFDRINGLFARLDHALPGDRPILDGSLASLRVGHNIMILRRLSDRLPPPGIRAVDAALAALERHFGQAWRHRGPSGPEALAALARAGEALQGLEVDRNTVAALVSVTAIWVTLSYQSEFFALPQTGGPALIHDLIVPTP
ncbi:MULTISPECIES: FUSC family protein [unclassified Inquilinus]|uniref:FUSC family protein n=1 Tax=unclassified Inquilinus TaxID=2645927 RepID=UPI003F8E9CAD